MSDRNRASASRRGFSLIELLIVISIILIIITMAVPKFNQAKRFANETGAITAIRSIHEAQVQYQSQYGRFATSLTELGPPQSGAASPASADLIDATFAAGVKSGYKLTVTGNQSGYAINANPETFGTSGTRTFYSDQTMVIRANDGAEPATASSKELR
jgi:type IV pilus assembly protein PilA